MKSARVSPGFSVATKLSAENVAAVAQLGFRSIIDVSPNSTSSENIAAAARHAFVSYRRIEKKSEKISDDLVQSFCLVLGTMEKPVLAFSEDEIWPATLWAICETKRVEPDVIIETLIGAGFDISTFHDIRRELDIYRNKALWSSVNFAISF